MKKVAIWGVCEAGKYLCEYLQNIDGYEVVAFIDSFSNRTEYCKIPVHSPDAINLEVEADDYVIAVIGKKSIFEIVEKLLEKKVESIYLLQRLAAQTHKKLIYKGKYIDRYVRKIEFSNLKPTMLYFEMPIVMHCNLSCKGCFVACNKADEKAVLTVDEIRKDLLRMKEVFHDLPWVRFYGGEPLLHPKLDEILILARQLFPRAEIDIITNGMVLADLKPEIYKCIRDMEITINISQYPPIARKLPKIQEVLSSYNLEFILQDKSEFVKFFTLHGENDGRVSARNCFLSGCRHLYKGRLSKCSTFMAFNKFNQLFGTEYEIKEGFDWFNIHSETFDAWSVVKRLNSHIGICKYCSCKSEQFEWAQSKQICLDDYIIKED